MRPSSITLPSLKVTVGSGSTTFLRLELVGVHGEAHGASRFAPVESRGGQNFVESLLLGLVLDQTGARHDHGVDAFWNLASNGNGGDFAKILNAAVGTAANENLTHGSVLNGRSPLESNVIQRTRHGSLTRLIMPLLVNLGNDSIDGHGILRGCPPGDGGCNVLGIDHHRLVVLGALVRLQRRPIRRGLIPLVAGGTHGPPLQIVKGDLVGSNDSRTRSGLDGHVGNGHACLH
mmetsp:Transcript_4527/g.10254  ORF Transcript_4527/g.10254 Transcript_4527/m.10254 type:complete len:233 (+) Transcript_4527:1022-1720(+)